jgi:predicted ABC-type transport system involved in lysophospholipase L1 biosynthesis ATPase subunit
MELILKLHRELGMTLILVTHDLAIAAQASRTIRMKDGRVVPAADSPPLASSPL